MKTPKTKKSRVRKVWRYRGQIYVRPCGRGVCLEGIIASPQIEDVLEGYFGSYGDFYAEIVVRRLPKHQSK